MQHNNRVERDGHELVGEEEPGEAVYSLAYDPAGIKHEDSVSAAVAVAIMNVELKLLYIHDCSQLTPYRHLDFSTTHNEQQATVNNSMIAT